MTTYTCPDGHDSTTDDYCDVCGMPITPQAAGAAAPAPAGSPAPAGGSSLDLDAPLPPGYDGYDQGGLPTMPAPTDRACPNCGASNLPDALYCEDCGYDFTTGQLPRPLEPPMLAAATPVPGPAAPPAPDTGAVVFTGSAGLTPGQGAAPAQDGDASAPAPEDADAASAGPIMAPLVTPTSAPGHVEWVAEVWVDPDWYASQDASDPCPSAGMPWVIPVLERTVLIGRVSASRNIHPQIDISTDSGVSRRHAQLSSDGQRWWVEDLQSANGTYVGAAGAPLPSDPLVPGQRAELAEDDRIYLGAWSRVVVRRATPEESTLGS